MKFVKKISEGKAYIYLDLEGLSLKDPNSQEPEKDFSSLLTFKVETYKNTSASASQEKWDQIFGPVHSFLKTMTETEKREYALMLLMMNYSISSLFNSEKQVTGVDIIKLEDQLGKMLVRFDEKVNLLPRLKKWVEDGNIPLPSFSGAGEAPQDTPSMTFYQPQMIRLTAITLLCKMMAPILGLFISAFKRRSGDLDGTYKEIQCVGILKEVLDKHERSLIEKLSFYTARLITQMLSDGNNFTHVFHGYTDEVTKQQIYAQLLTRRLVLVDLFKPKGNLATYITGCVRNAARTLFSNTQLKTAVATLTYTKENAVEEDGNLSNLEVESKISDHTADFEIIVMNTVKQLKQYFIDQYDLDEKILTQMVDFYKLYHVSITPFNSYLMGIVFSPHLGSAKSISLLSKSVITELLALLQLFLINQGFNDLVVPTTLKSVEKLKTVLTGNDSKLRSTWNNSDEFRQCMEKFTISCNGLTWYTGLEHAIMNLTSEQYEINVAPDVWDMLEEPSHNGETFNVQPSIARSVCILINDLYPN